MDHVRVSSASLKFNLYHCYKCIYGQPITLEEFNAYYISDKKFTYWQITFYGMILVNKITENLYFFYPSKK